LTVSPSPSPPRQYEVISNRAESEVSFAVRAFGDDYGHNKNEFIEPKAGLREPIIKAT